MNQTNKRTSKTISHSRRGNHGTGDRDKLRDWFGGMRAHGTKIPGTTQALGGTAPFATTQYLALRAGAFV